MFVRGRGVRSCFLLGGEQNLIGGGASQMLFQPKMPKPSANQRCPHGKVCHDGGRRPPTSGMGAAHPCPTVRTPLTRVARNRTHFSSNDRAQCINKLLYRSCNVNLQNTVPVNINHSSQFCFEADWDEHPSLPCQRRDEPLFCAIKLVKWNKSQTTKFIEHQIIIY